MCSKVIKKVFFLGSKQLGLTSVKSLYVSSPDTLSGIITINDSKDVRSILNNFNQFATNKKIPIYILKKPSELFDLIEKEKPDMIIVVGWYWIIKKQLLDKVPYGILGIHASLLPKYRGFAPLVWAIINGEKKTGISLFYFDQGIDSGDIVAQKEFYILENDTIKEVLEKAEKSVVDIIKENYPKILANEAPRIKQNHKNATYCSQRKPQDGRINWNLSNKKIHNFIRAQTQPYPGAFSFIKDKKITITKSKPFQYPYLGIPGLVCQINVESVIVCCGVNAIEILEITIDGENKPIPPANFIKYGQKFV